MPIEDPGTLTVSCDECGETEELDTTQYAGDSPTFGIEDSTLEAAGWSREGSDVFCPKCTANRPDARDSMDY